MAIVFVKQPRPRGTRDANGRAYWVRAAITRNGNSLHWVELEIQVPNNTKIVDIVKQHLIERNLVNEDTIYVSHTSA